VIRSGVFASWRWSLVVGGGAALVVLYRFLTLNYIAAMFALLFVALSLQLWLSRRDQAARRLLLRRLGGLVIAGVVLLVVVGPVIRYNWAGIRSYYVIAQAGEKQIRQQEFGMITQSDHLLYYPRSLFWDHAGTKMLLLGAAVLVAGLVLGRWWLRRGAVEGGWTTRSGLGVSFLFVALSLLVPVTVLTVYGSPSPLVANIMVPAIVWLVVLATLWLFRLQARTGFALRGLQLAALAVLSLGFFAHASSLSQHGRLFQARPDVEQITALYDALARHSQQMGWSAPVVSVNDNADYCWPTVFKPFVYERHHVLLQPRPLLGCGLKSVKEAEALQLIGQSDFVILNRTPAVGKPVYPFLQDMDRMRPQLLALCEQRFIPVGDFRLFCQDVTLYARPCLTVTGGTPDHWITPNGLKLSGPGAVLQRFPRIELRGDIHPELLDKVPEIRARVQTPGKQDRTIPAHMSVSGNQYCIVVDLVPEDVAEQSTTLIYLTFDTWFVPKEKPALVGPSADARRLVARIPEHVQMLPRPESGTRSAP
jgi:hypothetical protein